MTSKIIELDNLFRAPIVGTFSDIHIGNYRDNPVWHEIALDLASWIADQYRQRGIQDIIIPGDLFHNRFEISVQTLNAARKFLHHFDDFNVVITIGNHDAFYRDRSDVNSLDIFNRWPNVTVVSELTRVKQFGSTIMLVPWATPAGDIPSCDIAFGHFEFNGFKFAHHKICVTGEDGNKLSDRCNMIITGHFHLADERKYDGGKIVYLGTPYQLNWAEAGDDKFIYVVNIETHEFLEKIENKDVTPRHERVNLSQWIANGKALPNTKITDNFINLIVDAELKRPIEIDGEVVSVDDTTRIVEQVIAELNAKQPKDIRVTYNYNADAYFNSDGQFDGVDIPAAIREFISQLDIPERLREKVATKCNSLFEMTRTTI